MRVTNGCGGALGWMEAGTIRVESEPGPPRDTLDVKSFGAIGDGTHDDTAAVQAALREAERKGGATVHFSRGLYRLTDTLVVPPGTVLRGEGAALSDLFWANPATVLPAVVRGSHDFALEDLGLDFSRAENGLVADTEGASAGGVRLRRLRVRWVLYSGHLKPEEVDQRFRSALRLSTGGGDLLRLGGRNVEVTDCDLLSSGRVLVLKNARGAFVARNVLRNGRWGWYDIEAGEEIVFEENRLLGGDLMSTGGVVSTYGDPRSRRVFVGFNTFEGLYGWDREAVTTDAGGGEYVGLLAEATERSATYPESHGWKPGALRGHAAYVLAGRGKGQYRIVADNTDRTIVLEEPWQVVPDSSSTVGITWMRGEYLFVGNEVVDAGVAIQLYGVAFNSIVAENRSVRAGGFRSQAARYLGRYDVPVTQGVQPQMFIQYADNEIAEGSSYHMNENRGSVLQLDAHAPGPGWPWPMAIGFVFRGNRLRSFSSIRVAGAGNGPPLVEDVVIERNEIEKARVGIEIGPRVSGVVETQNRFAEVDEPVVWNDSRASGRGDATGAQP